MSIVNQIISGYSNDMVNTTTIVSVLLVVLLLSAYEFFVYRLVSHRAFYNRAFNISLAIVPFFISTIILCLQSNIVITLGTIGALAIIRFRTAIKDPIDMMYLLWSIHIGITCGCQLYEVAVITSLLVTIVLLVLENITFGKKPYVFVVHANDEENEKDIYDILSAYTKKYRVKSRYYTKEGLDLVLEAKVDNPDNLAKEIKGIGIERFSIIEYDSDDIF